jgi:hypothetical protein
VKVLADSFAFCDDAFSATTDENAMQSMRQGPNELPRDAVLFGLLAHNSEMYGIGTVYCVSKASCHRPPNERTLAVRVDDREK